MTTIDSFPFIVHLEDRHAVELEVVGGKGANLARLFQQNFCVPDAFIITTHAYQYVLNNDQTKTALSMLDKIDVDNLNELEKLSNAVKATVNDITLPNDMIDSVMKSYDRLCEKNVNGDSHVAVRSSATAEDLPENSFAGQQDTYLHVTRDNLIEKIKDCWASLFTARAISYRQKSNIDHKLVKLAVVVQEMVSSEVSGVVFTANPITGLRNEVVIDSTYGLGEALVSGLVTPDHYEIRIDSNQNFEILKKVIGEKSIQIIGKPDGGTETLVTKDNERRTEALTDEYILQLAKLAKKVERTYHDQPLDLEWSFTKGNLYILQVRPITTLFPIPKHTHEQSGLRCMISFATIQGFLEPLTPLGVSTIQTIFGHFLHKVGISQKGSLQDNRSGQHIFKSAANRLWIDITGILTSPVRSVFSLSMVDTGMDKIINHLKRSKDFAPISIFSSLKTYFFLFGFLLPVLFKSIRNFIFPRYGKKLYFNQLEKYHQFIDQEFKARQNSTFTDCVHHFENILLVLPLTVIKYAIPCVLPSIISLRILRKMANDPMDALALTRAVESNPTTEMNLTLWKLTILIRENLIVLKLFENESTNDLVKMYKEKSFEKNIQIALDDFVQTYGCRGIGEIDIGRRRWSDEPQLIIEQIKSYLKLRDPHKAIDKIHDQSKASAYEAFNRMEKQLKWPMIQRPLLNFLFNRLKILFSMRESPKFHGIIQTFGKCRTELLRKAQLAVNENFITHTDDICFLYINELRSLAADTDHKQYDKINYWKNLVAQRRDEYKKQMSYKRVPLIILSDGTTYYDATTIPDENGEQIELAEGEILGSPVSPGVYEGKVRIVDDPMNSQLQSGEILICTATDPAWTPLFPIAGALVLEMGGMLQHGAIVSREYGLPAVVGVANAKTIFHNGQQIQVNGSTGRIKVLSE